MSAFNQPYSTGHSCFNIFKDASGPFYQAYGRHQENAESGDERKKQEIDQALADAVSKLSFKERQQHEEILHGVDQEISDEEAVLSKALHELDHQLSMSGTEGTVYNVAKRMNPEYVNAKSFRVMFLRSNDYYAKAAARQILAFFDIKKQLFGADKLTKEITIDDLAEDDLTCLKIGLAQQLGKDRSGREVFLLFAGLPEPTPPVTMESKGRAFFYMFMRALRSEVTQLRGTVSIFYAAGIFKDNFKGKRNHKIAAALQVAIPRKLQAVHVFVDSFSQYAVLNTVINILFTGDLKARTRVHYGSQIECQYQLGGYGIPPQFIDVDSKLFWQRHIEWFYQCCLEDNETLRVTAYQGTEDELPAGFLVSSNGQEVHITPNENDVQFEYSKMNKNPGNKRFQALMQDYIEAYGIATDEAKRQIVGSVIDQIHEAGGRFLEPSGNGSNKRWLRLSDDGVRKKVMQAFRNKRRREASKNSASVTLIVGKPLPNDAIFGRMSERNPGTELMHSLIKDHTDHYESLDRGDKMILVEKIIETIQGRGGRFLQPAGESSKWIEVSHTHTRDRISKYFRNYRRPTRTKKK